MKLFLPLSVLVAASGVVRGEHVEGHLDGDPTLQERCPVDTVDRFLSHTDEGERRLAVVGGHITNGVVKLGVVNYGNLNVPGGAYSAGTSATTDVGVRFLADGVEYEATAQGCSCEGWGASATADGGGPFSGYANNVGGLVGVTLVDFASDGVEATSTVSIDGKLKVTHHFFPSTKTDFLYEVDVTYENIGEVDLTDLRYRRTMDWDADPTPFSECVTIVTGVTEHPLSYEKSMNNGFETSNPLGSFYGYGVDCGAGQCLANCDSGNCDIGPADHGAAFQFLFKDDDTGDLITLAPGDKHSFIIFYGGAPNKDEANGALAAVGAEVFSLGYNAADGCGALDDGTPATFIFAFGGLGGEEIYCPDENLAYCKDITVTVDGVSDTQVILPEDVNDASVCVESLALSNDSFDCGDLGENTVTLTVTGTNGVVDTCEATVTVLGPRCPTDVSILGDPHVLRWGQKQRSSFMGECDLVFAHSDSFRDGEGFDLHVRTTIVDHYSHVEAAALRIGDNVFTIDNKNHLMFNEKVITVDDLPLTFGDEYKYTINYPVIMSKHKNTENIDVKTYDGKSGSLAYRLDLDEDGISYIEFKTFGLFMHVRLHGLPADFGDSIGFAGEHGTGSMLSRAGELMEDIVDHGHEWKVQAHEPKLFPVQREEHDSIMGCKMPTVKEDRRHLRRANSALYEQAKEACSEHFPEDIELCIDDVMVAGDVEMVSAW